jgi:hypothetical protein
MHMVVAATGGVAAIAAPAMSHVSDLLLNTMDGIPVVEILHEGACGPFASSFAVAR